MHPVIATIHLVDPMLQEPIVDALQNTGLQEDCPFSQEEGAEHLTPESAREVPDDQFMEYAGRLNAYLQARDQNFYSYNSCTEELCVFLRYAADGFAAPPRRKLRPASYGEAWAHVFSFQDCKHAKSFFAPGL